MVEEIGTSPIISFTVKLYKWMSFLEPSSWKKLMIIPVIFMNIFQFFDVYINWGNLEHVAVSSYSAIVYFNGVVSFLSLTTAILTVDTKITSFVG